MGGGVAREVVVENVRVDLFSWGVLSRMGLAVVDWQKNTIGAPLCTQLQVAAP